MKRIAILISLISFANACSAQVAFNSLEEIWKYADLHNVNMKVAKEELAKAGYSSKQSYSSLLPQVNGNGAFTDNMSLQTTLVPAEIFGGQPGTYRSLQFGQQYVYNGNITAQVPLINVQNWIGIRIARLNEAISRDSFAAARKNIYQQIAVQFYSCLLMQEAARLSDQTAAIADSVLQLTNDKFNKGTLNQADVDKASMNLIRAQQSQTISWYQAAVAKNNLKSLLGLSVNDSLQLNTSLQYNLAIDTATTFQRDPAVLLASNRVKLSYNQYKQANKAFFPTLNALYSYSAQRSDNSFEPFSNAKGTKKWFPAQYWGIQMTVPIFSGGYRFYQVKKTRIAYEQSKDLFDNAQKISDINDENLKLNYRKSVEVLDKTKQVMNLALDNYTHISYRYDAGLASLNERLGAFKDYIDYQNQYLNSLSDMLVQLYQVKIRQQSFY